MKKLNALFLISILGAASLFAQTTPIPNGPTVTTPTPTPAGYPLESAAQAIVTSHHYTVNLAEITAVSGASGNVALFTFPTTRFGGVNSSIPSLWIIDKIVIRASTPVSGGAISDVTAQVKTAGNNYGSAQHVFTGASQTPSPIYVTSTSGPTEAGGATVNLALVSAGGNLSVATAGQIEVYITWHVL